MYKILSSLCVTLGFVGFAGMAGAQTWVTDSIRWFCDPEAGGTVCALEVLGPSAAGFTTDIEAYGSIQVLKGRTPGQGSRLITVPVALPCTLLGATTRCFSTNVIRLEANVQIATSDTLNALAINVYSSSAGKLFDWDGDGAITADKEGLMLSRGLMGLNGSAISDGITLTNGRTAVTAEQAVYMGVRNGWFQFVAPTEVPKALREGLLFYRCMLGLRGAALTSGLTDVAATGIEAQCDKLLASE
jgi:hypothetical protein